MSVYNFSPANVVFTQILIKIRHMYIIHIHTRMHARAHIYTHTHNLKKDMTMLGLEPKTCSYMNTSILLCRLSYD
jgi:hypothetical protein